MSAFDVVDPATVFGLVDDEASNNGASDSARFFRRWSMPALLDADRTFRWQARGLFVDPTYGIIGGERKTLKTYIDQFIDLGISTGCPVFGRFEVDEAAPVLVYIGEGGRAPYTRRLERVAAAMGVTLRDAPLFVSFDVAPVQSPVFQESLRRDLDELRPKRVSVDPFYAFHGSKANASNLYEEGELLTGISGPCLDAGASLSLVVHFNKTGTGRGLDRVTQAGAQEWADSWILLSHRGTPNVELGCFRLLVEVGSRQWGGATWELDLDVGRFDVELGDFDGAISWDLRRHTGETVRNVRQSILDVVEAAPWTYTKSEVLQRVGGNRQEVGSAFDDLTKNGEIVSQELPHAEGSRSVRRPLWAPRSELVPGDRTSWNELAL